jgi:hypothetical protein
MLELLHGVSSEFETKYYIHSEEQIKYFRDYRGKYATFLALIAYIYYE